MARLHKLLYTFLVFFHASLFGHCCIPLHGDVGFGYDYFRGLPDGDWEGNTGIFVGGNFGTEFSFCSSCFGVQMGGSYGGYDWHGRGSSPSGRQTNMQQQAFATAGLSLTTCCSCGFNLGVVYDWMWNEAFGLYAIDTSFDQIRFQGGYLFCGRDEIGLWGTLDLHWSERHVKQIPITYRALSQANLFWRHIFCNDGETMLWAGVPTKRSLMFSTGRAGKFIVGGSFKAPLTERLGIEGHASYMYPHWATGAQKQKLYGANICLELKWRLDNYCFSRKPYMPIGNNSNFFVDTNISN